MKKSNTQFSCFSHSRQMRLAWQEICSCISCDWHLTGILQRQVRLAVDSVAPNKWDWCDRNFEVASAATDKWDGMTVILQFIQLHPTSLSWHDRNSAVASVAPNKRYWHNRNSERHYIKWSFLRLLVKDIFNCCSIETISGKKIFFSSEIIYNKTFWRNPIHLVQFLQTLTRTTNNLK